MLHDALHWLLVAQYRPISLWDCCCGLCGAIFVAPRHGIHIGPTHRCRKGFLGFFIIFIKIIFFIFVTFLSFSTGEFFYPTKLSKILPNLLNFSIKRYKNYLMKSCSPQSVHISPPCPTPQRGTWWRYAGSISDEACRRGAR